MSESALFEQDEKPRKRRTVPKPRTELPAVQQQPPSLVDTIARMVTDKSLDKETVQMLVKMQAENEFNVAMVAMDEELPVINKDGKIQIRGGKPLRFASFENI